MKTLFVVAVSLALAASALACGAPPSALPPSFDASHAVRVVPADRVKGTCTCDDDIGDDVDDAPPRRPVEYVKMRDWRPPPAVEELEAALPPRGAAPPSYTMFPELTLHAPIASSSSWRWRGRVHAR